MPRLASKWRAALLAGTAAVALAWRPVSDHARAAALLQRFAQSGDHAAGPAVREETSMLDGGVRARLYQPDQPGGGAGARGIVLVPGVHHLGIDEPRLVRFARAIASSGVPVLTPEIAELVDYRIDAASVDAIGTAARALRGRTGVPVGVMGMSFAGGLALLTASDARFADDVAFVVAVGAHDDLARVARFFATNEIPRPDGSIARLHAHPYGPLVLVYARVERFFPASDVPAARDALRLWLWEQKDEARARAHAPDGSLSSRAKLDALFDDHLDAIVPELLVEIDADAPAMRAASPHDRLAALHCPVFLLHGTGDAVIPASETLWLARDVPDGRVANALLSPAIVHVELEGEPTLGERWALVHFMAGVLTADRR